MSINFTTLATSALGFTVALAWNDAVSRSLKSFYPPQNEKAAARHTLIYAVVITILVIFIVAVVNHARKVVYKHKTGGDPAQDNMRAQREPAKRDCADCGDCAHCYPQGLSPVVRLWEPPRARVPAR
jgi:hypothetical protein